MPFYFKNEKNSAEATRIIVNIYGKDAVNESTVRRWFAKFWAGYFDLEDANRPGRHFAVKNNVIKTEIEKNPRLTRELLLNIGASKRSIHNYLINMEYVSWYDVWVSHNISEKYCMNDL